LIGRKTLTSEEEFEFWEENYLQFHMDAYERYTNLEK
jgi:hypothetical protein